MKEVKTLQQNLAKLRKRSKDNPILLELIDNLIGLHLQLMRRVAALESRPGNHPPSNKPAREGTPGQRKEVNRDIAGRRTGEPKRTEHPTGRNNRKTTDIDRGII
jgi:hypothetical protein